MRIIFKFDQEAWLKPYIDMNTEPRKFAQKFLPKEFLRLINNVVFETTIENVRKHRDIKFAATETTTKYLVSESIIKNIFLETFVSHINRKHTYSGINQFILAFQY